MGLNKMINQESTPKDAGSKQDLMQRPNEHGHPAVINHTNPMAAEFETFNLPNTLVDFCGL